MAKPLLCIANSCKGCISCNPEIRHQAQKETRLDTMPWRIFPVELIGLSNRARAAALETHGIYTKLFDNNGELIKLF